jgi:hypothetical protein
MKTTDLKKPTKRSGFEGIFSGDAPEEKEIKKEQSIPTKKSEPNTIDKSPKEIRVTLQIDSELHQKVKIMAHWELTTLKEVIGLALQKTVDEYEKTHGVLARVPKSKNK